MEYYLDIIWTFFTQVNIIIFMSENQKKIRHALIKKNKTTHTQTRPIEHENKAHKKITIKLKSHHSPHGNRDQRSRI